MERAVPLTLFVLVLMVLGACGGSDPKPAVSASGNTSPGKVAPPDTAASIDGEKLYNRYCFSCHAAGIANAPKFGDPEVWQPRLAKGRDALLRSVVEGMPPGMPAKGLCNACSDAELAAVTDFMLDAVGPVGE